MTADMQLLLLRTERKILRMVVGCHRRKSDNGNVEPWVEWVKCATHNAEKPLADLQFEASDDDPAEVELPPSETMAG